MLLIMPVEEVFVNLIEIIKEFMRDIVTFSVLSAFCIHLLPEKKYQKFASFAVGLVYICMLLNMAGRCLGRSIPIISF